MNSEQRADTIALFERIAHNNADNITALASLRDSVFADELEGGHEARVLFCSPVTGIVETGANVWGLDWFDATGFATLYDATGAKAYHTGCDLNRPSFKDSGAPVYAAADGVVVFAGSLPGWKVQTIVIRHALENGATVYTRYGHVDHVYVAKGNSVKRSDKIAVIGDYAPVGPQGDHLHFDAIMFVGIEDNPGDWPGMDLPRLKAGYMNPVTLLTQRR